VLILMKKTYKTLLKIAIIILVIFLLMRIVVVRELIKIIFISFVIAYALKPVQRRMVSLGINKKLSAAILILSLMGLLLIMIVLFIPSVIRDSTAINHTMTQIKDFFTDIYERLSILNNNAIMYTFISSIYAKGNAIVAGYMNALFGKLLKFGENLLALAVVPVIIYYFLAETEMVSRVVFKAVPIEKRNLSIKITEHIDKILGRYIFSQFILSVLVTFLTFVILYFLKVDYALLLAILNGIFNLIPYFGPLFGSIPAILVALLQSPKTALWTALCLYIVQQIEGDLIAPKITGSSINIHPMLVILLLIIGGKLGGFIGMVLAVPAAVIIKVVYEDLNYYFF
jgi:predicted PurR-regulated permease PerM